MGFFAELKRRNVTRVAVAYLVAAWLLVQMADVVLPRIGLPDFAVTFVIVALAIGFIPASAFAWAFEWTPEGLKREQEVSRSESITPATGRKIDRLIIAVLVLVLTIFVVDEVYFERQSVQGSLVVLPFVNVNGDAENEPFSDGLSEELINVLAKVEPLRVVSRSSAFAYKGRSLPISQVAEELGVDHVVEGSIRRYGDRVRITARLVDARRDEQIWGETFEKRLDDILKIQKEISDNIVSSLKVALDVENSRALVRAQEPTSNAAAYQLYLQGRYAWRQRRAETIRKSIELFEQAVTIDPSFAQAWAAQSSAWAVLPMWDHSAEFDDEWYEKVDAAARMALALDPSNAEALSSLAELASRDLRWTDAFELKRQAIESEPRNASVHQWFAEMLMPLGYLDEALEIMLKAYELDPASPVINESLVWIAVINAEYELAYKHHEIAESLGLGRRSRWFLFEEQVLRKDWGEAFEILSRFDAVPTFATLCQKSVVDPMAIPELRLLLDEMLEDGSVNDGPIIMFCLDVAGIVDDDAERVAEVFGRFADSDYTPFWNFWSNLETGRKIRQTDAFKGALYRNRLVDFYRERGWPDRCRPVGSDDFECT